MAARWILIKYTKNNIPEKAIHIRRDPNQHLTGVWTFTNLQLFAQNSSSVTNSTMGLFCILMSFTLPCYTTWQIANSLLSSTKVVFSNFSSEFTGKWREKGKRGTVWCSDTIYSISKWRKHHLSSWNNQRRRSMEPIRRAIQGKRPDYKLIQNLHALKQWTGNERVDSYSHLLRIAMVCLFVFWNTLTLVKNPWKLSTVSEPLLATFHDNLSWWLCHSS